VLEDPAVDDGQPRRDVRDELGARRQRGSALSGRPPPGGSDGDSITRDEHLVDVERLRLQERFPGQDPASVASRSRTAPRGLIAFGCSVMRTAGSSTSSSASPDEPRSATTEKYSLTTAAGSLMGASSH
jgi:hypothetical protein